MLRDPLVIKEIIGYSPKGSQGAVINNFDLGYQLLEQIPSETKSVLSQVWGPGFKAYTIYPGKGVVAGSIWDLEEKDLELIKKWEFVGNWREIITIPAKLFNGNTIDVSTTKVFSNQKIETYVDGINYENSLNPQGKKFSYEEKFRKDEIEKIHQVLENIKKLSK